MKKAGKKKSQAKKIVKKDSLEKKSLQKRTSVEKKRIPAKPAKKQKPARKRRFEFTKMVASGNDFIVYDNRREEIKHGAEVAALLCPRTTAIGADGLILIERSRKADFKMRIFNPDGSEAEMCGNGIRCAALYKGKKSASIETLAGVLKAEVGEETVKVKMTQPLNIKLNVNLDIDGRSYQVNFLNTGVPHAIHFVQSIESTNVRLLGRMIRYHRSFEPEGTNVDFVEIKDQDLIQIRTYERGVEAETLACGTGSVAAALIYHHKFIEHNGSYVLQVKTQGDEILKVYFNYNQSEFSNVWLEGRAKIVYKGECYV